MIIEIAILIILVLILIRRPRKKGYISTITIFENNVTLNKIKGIIMELQLTNTQKAEGTLTFLDRKGNKTEAASVSVSSSDDAVASVSYDTTTKIVTLVAQSSGVTVLTITATNSKGENIPIESVNVTIVAGDAVSGTIAFSAPTEQP